MFELKIIGASNICSVGRIFHPIISQGNVFFKFDGQVKRINKVLYIFSVLKNLLSIGSITNEDCIITYKWIYCQIVSISNLFKIIIWGSHNSINRLYKLKSNSLKSYIYLIEENLINLWHLRLQYVN